jgi:hypothetical protein
MGRQDSIETNGPSGANLNYGEVFVIAENFMQDVCRYARASDDEDRTKTVADVEIPERLHKNASPFIYSIVDMELTEMTAESRERTGTSMDKELAIWLSYDDGEDDPIFEDRYLLQRYIGGFIEIYVRKELDGLAEALRHEDPVFMRAYAWREAAGYEVDALGRELNRLRAIREGSPVGHKVI